MHFVWSEEYSVGIQEIDKQHQHFFEIVNSIYDVASDNSIEIKVITDMVNKLLNYGLYHLSTEESLFSEYQYPLAKEHIQVHNAYRDNTKNYYEMISNPQIEIKDLAINVIAFASNWLLDHIINTDKKYSVFFQSKGLV